MPDRHETLIAEVDREVALLLDTINIDDLARHNRGYSRYSHDRFHHFIGTEKLRYLDALECIESLAPNGPLCDLGCFIPYLPMLLAKSGFKVKIVDRYELYGPQFFSAIRTLAERFDLELFDLDIMADDFAPLGENAVVFLMAVVEHLIGSPRRLMTKIRAILRPSGVLYFEVPNIARLENRIMTMLGHSPLPIYRDYLDSAYPFLGHNREMTADEVAILLRDSHFEFDRVDCYEYDQSKPRGIKQTVWRAIKPWLPVRNKYGGLRALAKKEAVQPPD